MKPLILAIQFMTRLPLPAVSAEPHDFTGAIRWFPMAGLVIGLGLAGAAWLGWQRDPWAGALLALMLWVAVTGALHLDGLGDIADAAGAAHADHGRISAVLADPHIGSFGGTAIALQLVVKLVLLRLALEAHGPMVLIALPAAARIGPLVWTLTLAPLHPGIGSRFGAGATWGASAAWLLALLAAAAVISPALLTIPPAIALWRWWLQTRIGGISGDGHGAGIELVETTALAALALWP